MVKISITDQGTISPPEHLKKSMTLSFQPKRQDNQRAPFRPIPICHSIIQKHVTDPSNQSAVGKRTTVHHLLACVGEPQRRTHS